MVGSSVAANHRAARRARSRRELISKLSVVAEEADESVFWLELIAEVALREPAGLASLTAEAVELRAIFAKSVSTLRQSKGERSTHDRAW
jgi:four helix bundle protein